MKRPLAYITAAWLGGDSENAELAAQYCRTVYEAGFSPICPPLYLPLFLNDAVCGCTVCHELSHTLLAVWCLPPTVCLADLPPHHTQHIRQSPRRQLGCFYGYGYRAPGNIFINQLHRFLPWDNLSRSAITDPHGLFSAFDGSPPKKNRL
jgi:hypothetical protein